ncbi:GIY-YIG nuclease family protein [Chroococcidiopsis sp. CCNUC1]|uniref:GIY-YIG nuclease family protein n=1 Tax=Chroococcidiopsis sp. CCNUC1 TaxID=2653189 RepID=UPI0020213113|nr:GIY-YIG nuclease family protein [Chroococcidiopsis sp. CCNUC1]URD50079.1 GIY-YIG nuclease family protein [Chroococcidiopsis sp. CCNUC1]
MKCGVYQITNTVNNKSYIGQSRNIQKRWRQHTRGLDRASALDSGSYPLRAAFLKYGLRTVVSKAGRIGVFEFNIIEECQEKQLLEREQFWIKKLNPEYNCNTWTPAKSQRQEKTKSKFWIQYHNYDKLGYLPAETLLDYDEYEYESALSCVSTNKRAILNAEGDTIFLIVGIGKNPKLYYLWSKIVVEEVEVIDEAEEHYYHAFGNGYLLEQPQLLNSTAFNKFKEFCGNFGFGLMSVDSSPYLDTLQSIAKTKKPQTPKINFFQYIEKFYNQVSQTNSKIDISNRLISRTLGASLYPDNVLFYLAGIHNTLVVFEPNNIVIDYKGKILLHTLDFYEITSNKNDCEVVRLLEKLRKNCFEILFSFELDEKTFPAHAIQGWATVEKVFKYDSVSFAADKEAHGLGDNLAEYQAECSMDRQEAWGIRLSNPVYLEEPVCDVLPPDNVFSGDIWFPQNSQHIEAFKIAFQSKIFNETD